MISLDMAYQFIFIWCNTETTQQISASTCIVQCLFHLGHHNGCGRFFWSWEIFYIMTICWLIFHLLVLCDGLLLLINIYPVRFSYLTDLFNFILGEFMSRFKEFVFDFATTLNAIAVLDSVSAIVHFLSRSNHFRI